MYARVLAVMPLLLSLAACQGAAVKPDYDLTHDFAGDQTWEWAEPRVEFRPSDDPRIGGELMAGRIEQAVAEQLDARGPRPVLESKAADLQVKSYVLVEKRQENVTTSFGGYWGTGWGGFWGGPAVQTYPVDYRQLTLQIDLLDGDTGRLVWRGIESERMSERELTPSQRDEQVQRLVSRILAAFPPY